MLILSNFYNTRIQFCHLFPLFWRSFFYFIIFCLFIFKTKIFITNKLLRLLPAWLNIFMLLSFRFFFFDFLFLLFFFDLSFFLFFFLLNLFFFFFFHLFFKHLLKHLFLFYQSFPHNLLILPIRFIRLVYFYHLISTFTTYETVKFSDEIFLFPCLLLNFFFKDVLESICESNLSLGICLIIIFKKALITLS